MTRRLTDQGRERKAQLLEHAERLFSERGFAETRVVDICEAAGVAKGLFYWYFDSKEALFAELVREMRLRLRREQQRAMDPSTDALTRLRAGAEASVRFMARHAGYFALLDEGLRSDEGAALLAEGSREHVADARRLIRDGIAEGSVIDADPDLLAIGLVSTVAHFSHHHRSGRLDGDVDALAAFVADWIGRALSAPPPGVADRSTADAALVLR